MGERLAYVVSFGALCALVVLSLLGPWYCAEFWWCIATMVVAMLTNLSYWKWRA